MLISLRWTINSKEIISNAHNHGLPQKHPNGLFIWTFGQVCLCEVIFRSLFVRTLKCAWNVVCTHYVFSSNTALGISVDVFFSYVLKTIMYVTGPECYMLQYTITIPWKSAIMVPVSIQHVEYALEGVVFNHTIHLSHCKKLIDWSIVWHEQTRQGSMWFNLNWQQGHYPNQHRDNNKRKRMVFTEFIVL